MKTLGVWAALCFVGCGARTSLSERLDSGARPDVTAPIDRPAPIDVPVVIDVPVAPDVPADAACVAGVFTLRARPAEIVFVVDRSGSFTETWGAVSDAFAAAIPAINGTLATGLLLYPQRACDVSPTLQVDVAVGNGETIVSTLRAVRPVGRTPTREAVTIASRALRARLGDRSKYLMLVTDGVPTCPMIGDGGDSDLAGTVAAVAESAAAGVPVFVIGVGGFGGPMGTSLDQLALAGARPTTSAGGHRYYVVENAGDGLRMALQTVQSSVRRCELSISTPAEGASVQVQFQGERVPEDPSARDGWWWSDARHTAISIHGGWCTRLVAQPGDLTARLTCPGE